MGDLHSIVQPATVVFIKVHQNRGVRCLAGGGECEIFFGMDAEAEPPGMGSRRISHSPPPAKHLVVWHRTQKVLCHLNPKKIRQ